MKNEVISGRQTIAILIAFLFGSSAMLGINTDMKQCSWISLLVGIAFMIPLALIYARILQLHPGMGWYEIMELSLGKVVGKLVAALYVWYALHLTALVLKNFSEFISISNLTETPQIPLMIVIMLVAVYLAKSGMETLGKWALIVVSMVIIVVVFTISTTLKNGELTNLQPVMEHGVPLLLQSGYSILTFPMAEMVLFLPLASAVKKQDSPYKMFLYALAGGGILLLGIILRNICCMGALLYSNDYFSSYVSARIIGIGDFFTRLEGFLSVNFILVGVIKITVCIVAAAKGLASIFTIKEDRTFYMPFGLAGVALATVLYQNTMEMINFLKPYSIYAIPFQIIFPIIVWIAAEWRAGRHARQPEALSTNSPLLTGQGE